MINMDKHFVSIVNQLRLTDKFFEHTRISCHYDEMNKEYYNLTNEFYVFNHTHIQNAYKFHFIIKVSIKRYIYCVTFNERNGMLTKIEGYSLPVKKTSQKECIKKLKKSIGDFISIMISHGYIEREVIIC